MNITKFDSEIDVCSHCNLDCFGCKFFSEHRKLLTVQRVRGICPRCNYSRIDTVLNGMIPSNLSCPICHEELWVDQSYCRRTGDGMDRKDSMQLF